MKAAQKTSGVNKVVSHRRTATQMLKKVGIAQARYSDFISCGEDGKFFVNIEDAVRSLQKPAKVVKAKAVKVEGEQKITLANTIRSMVLSGQTNEEIRESLQLPDNKRHYPAWYRAEMARKAAH
jgi:hypothetical protein